MAKNTKTETEVETQAEAAEIETQPEAAESPLAVQESAGQLATATAMEDDGFGEIDAGDMSIPFLTLLQDNSPQRKKQDASFIPGAEEGMILNTVSEELYQTVDDQGLMVIPVFIDKAVIEWKPRGGDGSGGGFVARHSWDHPEVVSQKAQNISPKDWRSKDGNVLKRTYYLWVLIVDPEIKDPDLMDLRNYAIVSFESTKAAVFQQWVSRAKKATMIGDNGKKVQVPLWRMMLKLGAKYQQSSKGNFFNYTLGFVNPANFEDCGWKDSILPADSNFHQAALAFREAITSGIATANTQSEERVSENDAGDTETMPF